jgi:hypothetical protein
MGILNMSITFFCLACELNSSAKCLVTPFVQPEGGGGGRGERITNPYPLYGPLFPLRPSVLTTVFCLLYSSLSPLWPLSSLRLSISSTALWPLATALCPLYSPLSSLRLSVPSITVCPFSLFFLPCLSPGGRTAKQEKRLLLFRKMCGKTHFVKIPKSV